MPEAVLHDRDADRRLRRDGFVVIPVLSPSVALELRQAYLDLDRPVRHGFVADLAIADPDYRRAADSLLSSHLDATVGSLFVSHVPFMRSFVCKYPDLDSGLYLHQDWSYVDERVGARTFVAWLALEDVTGGNGQLRVLRGSHRLDGSLRGTGIDSPWMRHQDVMSERLLTIPVPAGSCVVFDNALVHSSHPNHGADVRVVAAIGVRPRGVPLAYFRGTGEGHAEHFSVREEFFLEHTPQGLAAEPPAIDDPVPTAIRKPDMSARALGRRLDHASWLTFLESVRRRGRGARDTAET